MQAFLSAGVANHVEFATNQLDRFRIRSGTSASCNVHPFICTPSCPETHCPAHSPPCNTPVQPQSPYTPPPACDHGNGVALLQLPAADALGQGRPLAFTPQGGPGPGGGGGTSGTHSHSTLAPGLALGGPLLCQEVEALLQVIEEGLGGGRREERRGRGGKRGKDGQEGEQGEYKGKERTRDLKTLVQTSRRGAVGQQERAVRPSMHTHTNTHTGTHACMHILVQTYLQEHRIQLACLPLPARGLRKMRPPPRSGHASPFLCLHHSRFHRTRRVPPLPPSNHSGHASLPPPGPAASRASSGRGWHAAASCWHHGPAGDGKR